MAVPLQQKFHGPLDYTMAMRLRDSQMIEREFVKKIEDHSNAGANYGLKSQIEAELLSLYKECPSALQAVSEGGFTPFWTACFFYNTHMMRLLYELDPKVISDTKEGKTVLLQVCMGVEQEALPRTILLIKTLYELDPLVLEQVDHAGCDAFSLAAMSGSLTILQFLYKLDPGKALASMRQERNGVNLPLAVLNLFEYAQGNKDNLLNVLSFFLQVDNSIQNRAEILQAIQPQGMLMDVDPADRDQDEGRGSIKKMRIE